MTNNKKQPQITTEHKLMICREYAENYLHLRQADNEATRMLDITLQDHYSWLSNRLYDETSCSHDDLKAEQVNEIYKIIQDCGGFYVDRGLIEKLAKQYNTTNRAIERIIYIL